MNKVVDMRDRVIANATRRLSTMFPGYIGADAQTKHNYAKDFGWPDQIDFNKLYRMYTRNGMAKAAVTKTVRKTWEDNPQFVNDQSNGQNTVEKAIAKRMKSLRIWQKMAEADRRALVGGYSALIFRFSDGRDFDQPVGDIAGPAGLDGVIVAWATQITVSRWDDDHSSPTYGEPLMYSFNETNFHDTTEGLSATPKTRSFDVHPDRVLIWSNDGTIYGESLLKAGFNDLIDMEKIKGAGGEGFWKNAKAAPVLEVDKDASLRELAQALGVDEDGIFGAMDEQVENYAKGFDNLLMLQGIQAKPMNVQLSVPESYFMVALQSFAASVEVPLKILVGTQSGERASSEDAKEWSQTINARRNDQVIPLLEQVLERFVDVGILVGDWELKWTDLTVATVSQKLELAMKMSTINNKSDVLKTGEKVFSNAEIREAVGYRETPTAGTLEADAPPPDPEPLPAPSEGNVE